LIKNLIALELAEVAHGGYRGLKESVEKLVLLV
jgi:hypothetical protein